ncbi:hypothetical protein ANRL4_02922 [Anaerolineae bacterium]|nr:hypothetical protein ANRL4_02922 [Anaerolineae bacterium]
MRNWLLSLNGAVTLAIVAFATLIARVTFLDALYVPEFRVMFPESQPAGIALMILIFMVFIGVWVWSLLAASRGSRGGLTVVLLYNLFTALGGGLITLIAFCPIGCAAPPVGDAVVWANLIVGLLASVALGFHLTRPQRKDIKAQ